MSHIGTHDLGRTTALVPGLVVPAANDRGLKGLEE
jgi:hypothetical protein